jgi:hypothetical protein
MIISLAKQGAIEISMPLTYIFNNSLKEGTYPERLKYSLVKPIRKKGHKSDMTNDRPISLLIIF